MDVVGNVVVDTLMEMPASTDKLINDPDKLPGIFEQLYQSPFVALDTETTGLDFMRDQLHGISVATASNDWYITGPAMLASFSMFKELAKEKRIIGHNIKYDEHFLIKKGIKFYDIADTLIAQWLVDENMELGLKSLAGTRLGITDLPTYEDLVKEEKLKRKVKKLSDITIYDLPQDKLAEYGARDARLTFDLWNKLAYDLQQEDMESVFWNIEMPFSQILFEMEEAGIYVNPAAVAEVERKLRQRYDTAVQRWHALAGNVNFNSTKQLATLFYDTLKLPKQDRKTKSGADAMDAITLMRLEPADPSGTVKTLREIKETNKILTTYIPMLTERPFENRIHGSFNQCMTVTGRLSSSDPNLQNIPAHGEIGDMLRSVFQAPEGTVLIDIDYSQIELRTLASDAHEDNFLNIFEHDGDPHQMTADLAKLDRQIGKKINFMWAYGASARGLCDAIEKDGNPRPKEADAKAWLDQFNNAYPKLVKYKQNVIRRACELGYVPTYNGRKRRLPDLYSPINSLRSAAERQAVNARIQASCADMLKWAMLQLNPYCNWFGGRIVAQVHDELLIEAPKDNADDLAKIAQSTMESIKDQYNLAVKIVAEPGIGSDWHAAKG